MTGAVVAGCAVVGAPVGWLAWRVAQTFIDRRTLEAGDTEIRLPWTTTAALEVVVFGGLGWRLADDPRPVLVVYLALFAVFTTLLLIDFARYTLPNELVLTALVVGVAGVVVASLIVDSAATSTWSIGPAITGVVVNLVMYFLFWLLAQVAFGSRGLGFGDVKLAAPLGLAVGWLAPDTAGVVRLALWALLIGFASGAISSIVLLRGVKLRESFPQGPFLVLGTFVVVVASASLL